MKIAAYSKAIIALVVAIASWAAAALTDGSVSVAEWGALAGAVATALGVFAVPNVTRPSLPPPLDEGHASWQEIALVAVLVLVVLIFVGVTV